MKNAQNKDTGKSENGTMVKPKGSAAEGLRELFIDELKDIIYAERALLKALPKMANNSSSIKLKKAIEKHVTLLKSKWNA